MRLAEADLLFARLGTHGGVEFAEQQARTCCAPDAWTKRCG
ncbi:hypothetical protein [Sphingomonas tagetis]|nr:hypothetical protein [Sphingomonas tagetis]